MFGNTKKLRHFAQTVLNEIDIMIDIVNGLNTKIETQNRERDLKLLRLEQRLAALEEAQLKQGVKYDEVIGKTFRGD